MTKYDIFDLQKQVTMLDGKPAKTVNATGDGLIDFNVMEAFRRALNGNFPDEQPGQGNPGLKFEEKMKRYEISKKIWNADEKEGVSLETEEQAELKKCVGKMYSGEVLGFLVGILEKKPAPEGSNKTRGSGNK